MVTCSVSPVQSSWAGSTLVDPSHVPASVFNFANACAPTDGAGFAEASTAGSECWCCANARGAINAAAHRAGTTRTLKRFISLILGFGVRPSESVAERVASGDLVLRKDRC